MTTCDEEIKHMKKALNQLYHILEAGCTDKEMEDFFNKNREYLSMDTRTFKKILDEHELLENRGGKKFGFQKITCHKCKGNGNIQIPLFSSISNTICSQCGGKGEI